MRMIHNSPFDHEVRNIEPIRSYNVSILGKPDIGPMSEITSDTASETISLSGIPEANDTLGRLSWHFRVAAGATIEVTNLRDYSSTEYVAASHQNDLLPLGASGVKFHVDPMWTNARFNIHLLTLPKKKLSEVCSDLMSLNLDIVYRVIRNIDEEPYKSALIHWNKPRNKIITVAGFLTCLIREMDKSLAS